MLREASTHLSRNGEVFNMNRVLKERSKQRNRKTEAQKDKKTHKKSKKEFQDKKPHSGPARTRLERAEGLQETLCTCPFGAGVHPAHVLLDTELGPHTHSYVFSRV